MARFRGDKSSALGIVGQLLGKPDVVLKIQEELQDGRPLQETIAGKVVQQDIQEKKRQHEETLQELEELRESQKNPTRYFIRRIFMRRTAEEAGLKKNIEDEKLLERKISIKAEKEIEEAKAERRHKGFIPTILAILGVLLGIVNAAQENMPL
ncbi:hypothetical protein L873DRAFT_1843567 [Choiromyces venosus 120613-1]|uniref:Uncharacterized protein n=1 Tax=Choiromyces venosus 120613-1 TaxID=1336337 RepID=A0A3N4JMI3_9PEZI|nr:hypothetical protein L873DRAFT_1843567 [Choiromyces venosus 120613-1]